MFIYSIFRKGLGSISSGSNVICFYTEIDEETHITFDLPYGRKALLFTDEVGNQYVFDYNSGWFLANSLEESRKMMIDDEKVVRILENDPLKSLGNPEKVEISYDDFFFRCQRGMQKKHSHKDDISYESFYHPD